MSAPQDPGPIAAAVLTHPAFDRDPVQNLRVPGRRKGVVNLSAVRRKRLEAESKRVEATRLHAQERAQDEALRLVDDPDRPAIDRALRILADRLRVPGACFNSTWKMKNYLILHLAELKREAFGVVFLDAHMRMIVFEVMFQGTVTQATVHPREVVRRALELNAVGVVLTHNHPSGFPEPSLADECLTHVLKQALNLVDVRTVDHIIVGGLDTFSFAERGLM